MSSATINRPLHGAQLLPHPCLVALVVWFGVSMDTVKLLNNTNTTDSGISLPILPLLPAPLCRITEPLHFMLVPYFFSGFFFFFEALRVSCPLKLNSKCVPKDSSGHEQISTTLGALLYISRKMGSLLSVSHT